MDDRVKYYGKKAAIGAAIGVGAVVLPGVALNVAGFTSTGVLPGTVAAIWQSSIGNVAAGSLFAACQSAGAAGLSMTTMCALGTVGFATTHLKSVANGTVFGAQCIASGISTVANGTVSGVKYIGPGILTAANGSVYGAKCIGSEISNGSHYLWVALKSKL